MSAQNCLKRCLEIVFLSVFFGFILIVSAYSGTFQDVHNGGHKYYDIASVKGKIWIVGERGTILYGTIGKEDWTAQKSGVMDPLNGVAFIDENNGVIVGGGGLVLFTENGGQSWLPGKTPKKLNLLSVFALDKQNIWTVGERGTILCSRDGGKNWEDVSLSKDPTLNYIFFANGNEGWITGEFGTILATKDAGKTWVEENLSPEKEGDYLFSIQMNKNIGIAAGSVGVTYLTVDGGKNWERKVLLPGISLYDFVIADNGSIVVVGEQGYIFEIKLSPDTGTVPSEVNRKEKESPTSSWLSAIKIIDKGTYLACGNHGMVVVSQDAGGTWRFLK